MIADATTPDTQNVSRFLAKLVLCGNFEAAVSQLYEHVPESEREAIVERVLFKMYLNLAAPLASEVRAHQNLFAKTVTQPRRDPVFRFPSGRTYPLFGGIKRTLGYFATAWVLIYSMIIAAIHHRNSFHIANFLSVLFRGLAHHLEFIG